MSSDAIIAESIRINGHGGDEVEGYCARPLDPGRQVGGVVVCLLYTSPSPRDS